MIALGGGTFYASSMFPPEYRKHAQIGGALVAGIGAILAFKDFQESGGVLGNLWETIIGKPKKAGVEEWSELAFSPDEAAIVDALPKEVRANSAAGASKATGMAMGGLSTAVTGVFKDPTDNGEAARPLLRSTFPARIELENHSGVDQTVQVECNTRFFPVFTKEYSVNSDLGKHVVPARRSIMLQVTVETNDVNMGFESGVAAMATLRVNNIQQNVISFRVA